MTRVQGKLKPVPDGSRQPEKTSKETSPASGSKYEKKKHIDGSVKNTGLATVKKTERKKFASIFASRLKRRSTGLSGG